MTLVTVHEHQVRFSRPFASARGTLTGRDYLQWGGLTDTGRIAYGETAPWPGLSVETFAEAKAAADRIALQLQASMIPESPVELTAMLDDLAREFAMPPSVRFGLETMFADLAAQAANLSIAAWFAADAAETVPVNALVAAGSEASEAETLAKIAEGYRTVKLKLLGVGVEDDIARVRRLRDLIGPEIGLRLDANRCYDFNTATTLLSALEAYDIEYVEEPLVATELSRLPELAKRTSVPLALDETVIQRERWQELLAAGAAEVVVLKPTLVGGLAASHRLAAIARSCGADVVVTTMIESGIGTLACLQAAASLQAVSKANGLATLDLFAERTIGNPPVVKDGWMALPPRPGLGTLNRSGDTARSSKPGGLPEIERIGLERHSDGIFIAQPGETKSYKEFGKLVFANARALQLQGIGKGDRVALLGSNSEAMITAILALDSMGAAAVPLNLRWLPQQWQSACVQAGVKLLLSDGEFATQVDSFDIKTALLSDLLQSHDGADFQPGPIEFDPTDVATIVFTSGSSGEPKGVQLTYRNHNCSALGSNRNLPLYGGDCWLLSLPLYHVGGLGIVYRTLRSHASIYIAESFDPAHYLELITQRKVNLLSLAPTMLQMLLDQWDEPRPPGGLKAILLGGAPVSNGLREMVSKANWPVFATYGLTETASQVTTMPYSEKIGQLQNSGRALQYRRVAIVDDTGNSLPPGEIGEIAVGGEVLSPGYLDRPLPLTDSGLFRTGDLGSLDADGYLMVKGRRDQMLISGGENIYPAEIVAAAESCPGVVAAAVIALADETWGQRPLLCVEVEAEFSLKQLRAHLKANLARIMVPERIEALNELPRTAIGKVDFAALQRRFDSGSEVD